MAKKDIVNRGRIAFPKGQQRAFLEKVEEELAVTHAQIAKILGIHERTFRDWKREKFLMSALAFHKLLSRTKFSIPKNITYRSLYWYVEKGAYNGGKARYEKYGSIGDPVYRLKRWREWWEREGKFTSKLPMQELPFSRPKKSEKLAEFFGIMMGDGNITRSQIKITLHHIDDFKFSKFVAKMMKGLFKVEPSIYHRPEFSVRNIVISRSGLVKYLMSLGLVKGSKVKQNFDIPIWIKNDERYLKACIRGLIDTDGCVFKHSYMSNGKRYTYTKLAFTTMSAALRSSMYTALQKLGFRPRLAQDCDVRLDSKADIAKYFQIIGSHNPKHLKKLLPH